MKIKKIAYVLFICVLAAFLFKFMIFNENLNGDESVVYIISNVELEIPVQYHYRYYTKNKKWPKVPNDKIITSYISLEAYLPDISPISPQKELIHPNLGWSNKIRIRLSGIPQHSFNRRFERYISNDVLVKRSSIYPQLDYFHLKLVTHGQKYDDLFILQNNKDIKLHILCNLKKDVTSPSCKAEQVIADNLYLSYTFSKRNLDQWKSINKSVIDKIISFCMNQQSCIYQKEF